MKGIVLSGGEGTRLRPITHTEPKQLVPVANTPVLQYAIEDMKRAGITDIGVVLGNYGRDAVKELLGDGSRFGVDITYILQGNPLGLAHAVGTAREFVGDDQFVVFLGDNMVESGIAEFVDTFRTGGHDAGIALKPVENPQQFGIADVDDDGAVRRIVEKPDDPPSDLAVVGIYAFTPRVFDVIEDLEPSPRGELEITDAIQGLLDDSAAVFSHTVEGWWKDTGKPNDVLHANELVLDAIEPDVRGTVAEGATTAGPIHLGQGSRIEPGATVEGPASIASDTRIGPGASIGPYTSIGNGCVVESARVEGSVVMEGTTIDCEETIVESLIGKNSEITSGEEQPAGERLVIGEHTSLRL